jgi:hypothetical protein
VVEYRISWKSRLNSRMSFAFIAFAPCSLLLGSLLYRPAPTGNPA